MFITRPEIQPLQAKLDRTVKEGIGATVLISAGPIALHRLHNLLPEAQDDE